MLSSQDQEAHPITPTSRGKKSVSESIGVASGQLSETEALASHSSSAVQPSSAVKIVLIHFNEQIATVLLPFLLLFVVFDFSNFLLVCRSRQVASIPSWTVPSIRIKAGSRTRPDRVGVVLSIVTKAPWARLSEPCSWLAVTTK